MIRFIHGCENPNPTNPILIKGFQNMKENAYPKAEDLEMFCIFDNEMIDLSDFRSKTKSGR